MRLLFFILLFTVPMATSISSAGIYKYKTDDGISCFTDNPGNIPDKYKSGTETDDSPTTITIVEEQDIKGSKTKNKATRSAEPKTRPYDGTIMLYVRDRCPYGDKTEAYLKQIGASYSRQDITGKDEMFKTDDGRYGSVVVIVGNKTIRGFSEAAISQAIGRGGN